MFLSLLYRGNLPQDNGAACRENREGCLFRCVSNCYYSPCARGRQEKKRGPATSVERDDDEFFLPDFFAAACPGKRSTISRDRASLASIGGREPAAIPPLSRSSSPTEMSDKSS